MNWYRKYNEKQRAELKQADVMLEDKDYSSTETEKLYDTVVTHIVSQSKNDISNERMKFMDILEDFKKEI